MAAALRAIICDYITFLGHRRSPADTPGLPRTLTDNDHLRAAPAMGLRLPARGYTLQKRERGSCLWWRANKPKVTGSIDGAIGRDHNEPAWPAGHEPLG